MRIFVTGWDGLLGHSLVPLLRERHDVEGLGLPDGDLLEPGLVAGRLAGFRPDAVVHLAAMTAVDRCEDEPEEAFRVNRDGTRLVAEAAGRVPVLALSTDYVFDGTAEGAYREEDEPSPLGVYGASKLAGERALRESGTPWTVVRTAWLFGPGGPNFVETILRLLEDHDTLPVVDDQHGCPTYTRDLARGIRSLVERGARGLYHVAGGGEATWCDLAREAARLAGLDPARVTAARTGDVPRPAPRPRRSVLDCGLARRELGIALRPWREALADYMRRRTAPEPGGPWT